ncbi:MAG: glutamine--fructose-6-phosphate transaminase (isomerizing) [Candidatus Heimdallarchaeaceae archaeon]
MSKKQLIFFIGKKMCGIVGIIQKNETKIGVEIIQALQKLEYRGYDSLGVAIIENDNLIVQKDKGKINEVVEKIDISPISGKIAIGHTRWATHGPPSKINAHPHVSCDGKIAVVHNGIIENFQELRRTLKEKGHKFSSETDTEVISHLIEDFFINEQLDFREAVIKAIEQLVGTYAICVISTNEPQKIYCAKKDSPLVIGLNSNRIFVASDIPAFLDQTQQVVLLHDNEFVEIRSDGYDIVNLKSKEHITRTPYTVSWKAEMAQKAGYPHFMLKEIHEQPNSLYNYIRMKQKSVKKIAEKIHAAERIFFVAAGTAYYSTLTGEYLVRKFNKKLSQSIIASEFESILDLIDENTVVVPVSQSGETMDTILGIKKAKEQGASILSIVNVVGSTITRYSDEVIYLHAGPEIGVAATKTYLAQTIANWDVGLELGLLSGAFNKTEYESHREKFNQLPKIVKTTITNNEVQARTVANWFSKKKSGFYLARGINVQTANEGALKMKEISYIHCESYPAGESKHGPIALVEKDFPVVFIAPKDHTYRLIQSNIMEMNARGASTIGVIEENDDEIKNLVTWSFKIPQGYSEIFSTIPYVVPLQLLAYYTAVKRGYSPDKPRNLAKSVTVL